MQALNNHLPHTADRLFLTDGGLETWLVFHQGWDLRHFAAFELLNTDAGRRRLTDYYREYLDLAVSHGLGFVLESPTWRANPDWGSRLGYRASDLAAINCEAIRFMEQLRASASSAGPILISGCVGPRGDGYDPGETMTAGEAEHYHAQQIGAFRASHADMVSAITMTNAPEAAGIARAARNADIRAVISFTVETDGCLPTGQPLAEAIAEVDAATDVGPAYYMINCAHPSHFKHLFSTPDVGWQRRIRGLRTNASRLSHEELDAAETLDEGDPHELGALHRALKAQLPWLSVVGGCCGTDLRHVEQICLHWHR